MNKTLFALDKINLITQNKLVLYAGEDFEVYKSDKHIVISDCDSIVGAVPCPMDCKEFYISEFEDYVVMMISGKHILEICKSNLALNIYDIPVHSMGRSVGNIHLTKDGLIFGTILNNNIQFFVYDYANKRKIAQSSSWKLNAISDIKFDKNRFYALLDSALLVSLDSKTCETYWTRFEAELLTSKILLHKSNIICSNSNHLFLIDNNGQVLNDVRLTESKVHELLLMFKDELYFTSNKGLNLTCFDLQKESMKWELVGTKEILDALLIKGQSKQNKYDIMLTQHENHIGFANITTGRSFSYIYCHNISEIVKTEENVLLQKNGHMTDLLSSL